MKEEFIAFLEKHGVLEKFKTDLQKVPSREANFDVYINHSLDDYDYINRAFTWDKTPEKYSFWSNLHMLWHKEVNKKNN